MNWGMLWADYDPKRPLEEKVRRAAEHYRRKYGHSPDRVYLNAKAAADAPAVLAGLKVLPSRSVLPNHMWLGVAEQPEPRPELPVELADLGAV